MGADWVVFRILSEVCNGRRLSSVANTVWSVQWAPIEWCCEYCLKCAMGADWVVLRILSWSVYWAPIEWWLKYCLTCDLLLSYCTQHFTSKIMLSFPVSDLASRHGLMLCSWQACLPVRSFCFPLGLPTEWTENRGHLLTRFRIQANVS